jgi:predicted anti-sigma-YlaC factor YlaD
MVCGAARRPLVLALVAVLASGCSVKRLALKGVADTLSDSGSTFASDDDPELVRAAVPFSLKLMESVLEALPEHRGLLLSACSGFTQYAYAFVQTDADLVESTDFDRAEALRARARSLYLRARDYCVRHLELKYRGIRGRLVTDPKGAVANVARDDVAGLYWTGAAWGSAIALGVDRPDLLADLPAVRALFDRALALDETWGDGAIHAALISLDANPMMGGSPAKAREHFARAVELSRGLSASPYVTLAASVSVAEQNRAEFEKLLQEALAIDPDRAKSLRLANILAQRRARHLLSRIDELFVGGDTAALRLLSARVLSVFPKEMTFR